MCKVSPTRMGKGVALLFLAIACASVAEAARGVIHDHVASIQASIKEEPAPTQNQRQRHLNATQHGYLAVDDLHQSKMYYMFYEAREVQASSTTPIVLWLQVRGCFEECADVQQHGFGEATSRQPVPSVDVRGTLCMRVADSQELLTTHRDKADVV